MKIPVLALTSLLVAGLLLACEPIAVTRSSVTGYLLAPANSHFPEGASYELRVYKNGVPERPLVATVEGTLSGGKREKFSLTHNELDPVSFSLYASVYAASGLELFAGQLSHVGAGELSIPMQGSAMSLKTLVLECLALTAVIRLGPGEAALFLPGRYVVLSQQRATSGAKYTEGDATLWLKGDNATLILAGASYSCKNNRRQAIWEDAKLSGASFRAVGNEPGWVLVIDRGRLDFSYDYGQLRLQAAIPEPVVDRGNGYSRYQFIYQTELFDLKISMQSCTDSMTGEQLESTVEIDFSGRQFVGCGKALY